MAEKKDTETQAPKTATVAKKTTSVAKATAPKAETAKATAVKEAPAKAEDKKEEVAVKQAKEKTPVAAKTTAKKTAAKKTVSADGADKADAPKAPSTKAVTTKAAATAKDTAENAKASAPATAKKSSAKTPAAKTTTKKSADGKSAADKAELQKESASEAKPTAKATVKAAATTSKAPAKKTADTASKTPETSTESVKKTVRKAASKAETKPKAESKPEKASKAQEKPAIQAAEKQKDESKSKVEQKTETEAKAEPKVEEKTAAVDKAEAAPVVEAAVEAIATDIAGQVAAVAEQEVKDVQPEKGEPIEEEPVKLEFEDVPGVLIAASECAPFVKVGGLADVVGALPKYLKKLGVDARVIMPFHRPIKDAYGTQTQHMFDFQASLGWRSQYVGVEKLELDGAVYYFIDNEFYFGGPIYCEGEFEGEQYAFFTRAVMDAIPLLDFDVRILHCNDWHTAMMPLLAKTQYQGGMQAGLRTVLTIHNLLFQGQFSHEFDRDLLRVDDYLATPQFIEHYGCDNMLKAGIMFADKVTTVSPTYAREICDPVQGESLDGVLRSRGGDLVGILNGIDTDVWNPQTDDKIPVHFSVKSAWRKREVRDALLEELGLEPAGEYTAVIGMVGRLTPQKGVDLVNYVIDELMYEDVRVIILGSGWPEYEESLRNAEYRHKGRLCSYIGYNADLSHRIYAGCDLFLMPSLFEPCGISQMIAMRYGTLPIVRETGGLRDTVTPYNEYTGEGNGFSFANYDAGEMLNVIRWALWIWRGEPARKRLIKQAMETDFSFDRCARSYAELYRSLF